MRVVWDRGEAAVGEVWEAVSQKRPIARNTVQTVIARLAQKGWLKHRKQGRAFLYRAAARATRRSAAWSAAWWTPSSAAPPKG